MRPDFLSNDASVRTSGSFSLPLAYEPSVRVIDQRDNGEWLKIWKAKDGLRSPPIPIVAPQEEEKKD